MKVFIWWINCGEEQKEAFENRPEMRLFVSQLEAEAGNIVRKIRVIRFIRTLIKEGIIGRRVKEMYEVGCKILSEMEGRREEEEEELGQEEEEKKKEIQEAYMVELYLLKVEGIKKNIKENEMLVYRREIEGLRRTVEEEKQRADEEKKRTEREKQIYQRMFNSLLLVIIGYIIARFGYSILQLSSSSHTVVCIFLL